MRKFKVLLVDDEPDIVELLRYNFQQKGFDVYTACDGEQALSQALSHQPDIVVSDIMMPVMSGVKMCTRMKENAALKDIPILFLSAASDDMMALASLDAGGDKFLSKPIRLPVLFNAVHALLSQKATSR